MTTTDYWKEAISDAAQSCDLRLTHEQLACLAETIESAHENYGMAFYSPPSTDRISDIERAWKAKLEAKEKELEQYRANVDAALKRALNQRSDAQLSIGEYGAVFCYNGRVEQIQ